MGGSFVLLLFKVLIRVRGREVVDLKRIGLWICYAQLKRRELGVQNTTFGFLSVAL